MKYDFDTLIDRKNTYSLKYDFAIEKGRPADVLPLWVADMDFKTLPEITRELTRISEHGIFGYSEGKETYFTALKEWFEVRFDWQVQEEWLVKTPGVVFAIAMAIRAFTNEGDAVIIQEPVYYPFSSTILVNKRKVVNNELLYKEGEYEIDFEDFEAKVVEHKVKLFILCSPHNPVGRVWTQDELIRLGDICTKHDVIIVADEIHADFVYSPYKHTIFASIKPEYLKRTITCTAPSKTFNLAGLQISNLLIQNPVLRDKMRKEMQKSGYSQVGVMGLIACQTAYTYGHQWVDELKDYLSNNLDFLRQFLKERLPQLKLVEPQGTYLVWIDCSALTLTEKERQDLIVHKAKLWLDRGSMFGKSGEKFERINIACPKATLEQALCQLEKAMQESEK